MACPNYIVLHRRPYQRKFRVKSAGYGNRGKHWRAYLDCKKLPGQSRFVTVNSTSKHTVNILEVGVSEYNIPE